MGETAHEILLVGSGAPGALERSYERALRRQPGVAVRLFSVDEGFEAVSNPSVLRRVAMRLAAGRRRAGVRKRLLAELRKSGNPVDAIIVFKGMDFSRPFLESCRREVPTAAWVNLNPDDPTNLSARGSTNIDVLKCLDFFDLYVTWSLSLAGRLEAAGCRSVLRLPFGYDADTHRPPGTQAGPRAAISFVGTWDQDRERTLASVADGNLQIFGANWNRASGPVTACVKGGEVHGEEFARVIHDGAASINLLRPQNFDSHNMRTFEIPAVGGLMFTPPTPELPEFLRPGTDCVTFENPRELREALLRVARDPGAFEGIRQSGHRAILPHSYDARARVLVEHLAATVARRREERKA